MRQLYRGRDGKHIQLFYIAKNRCTYIDEEMGRGQEGMWYSIDIEQKPLFSMKMKKHGSWKLNKKFTEVLRIISVAVPRCGWSGLVLLFRCGV